MGVLFVYVNVHPMGNVDIMGLRSLDNCFFNRGFGWNKLKR